ncbi:MAG: MFS transporter [Firmicutes bacterium]|nr:MFS transporter [Bacillota bacterium]
MAIQTIQEHRVPLRKKLAYSTNQLSINLVWQAFNTVAVYYYVTVQNVSGTAISVGMIVYGIVNAFLNLWAGYVSDRTRGRLGRRIPYVLFGTIPLSAAFYFLFRPPHIGPGLLLLYFLALTFAFDLCFTVVALNVGALYPEMYRTQRDRSYVSAWQQFFGIIGLIAGVALSKSLGQSLGWGTMALLFAVVSVIFLFVSLYGSFEDQSLQENSLPFVRAFSETLKNRLFQMYVVGNFLIQLVTTMFTTLSSFYTKYVVPMSSLQSTLFLGFIFIVAIPMSFVWARIAIRYSAARATLVATVLYGLMVLVFLILHTPLLVIVTGAFGGIPIAGFLVLLNILLADVIDQDERQTGRRREGMYLGVNGFIVRIGISVQYAIMAIFFAVSGFNPDRAVQQMGAINGFRILMGAVPAAIVVLAFLAFAFYRRRVAEVAAVLKAQ